MGPKLLESPNQMANKYMKKMLHIIYIRKPQIKMTFTSMRIAKIQNTDNTECLWDGELQKLSFIAGGNAKWYSHFGQFGGFLQN